jgi:hypothetical protein
MSIWKKFDDESDDFFSDDDMELNLNHAEYDRWLDSLNEEGDDITPEEAYNNEMKKVEYPEYLVITPDFQMVISNN